ncbi:MAG: DUF3987 domain-containing protein, partial [Candidatus Thermoplasmatota archaeon]
ESNILYDLYTDKDIGNPIGILADSKKNTQRDEIRADTSIPSSYPIPTQLRRPELRFIKVAPRDKIPVEKDWQNTKNYAWDDPELVRWITTGGNYGILPRGGICVIDIDDIGAAVNLGIIDHFDTFTVRSGSGKGIHAYLMCEGIKEKIPFYDMADGHHIGEFYGTEINAYIVGPGSIHPSDDRYAVTKNKDLMAVTPEQLDEFLFRKVKSGRFTEKNTCIPENARFSTNNLTGLLGLRIEDYVMPFNAVQHGDEWQGSHPIHGSTTGNNFCVNSKKNVYYCHRDGVGGDPVSWIAQTLGASCLDVKNGVSPDYFKKVVDWLWDNGYGDKLATNGYKHSLKQPSQDIKDANTLSSDHDDPPALNHIHLTLNLEDDNFFSRYIKWAEQKTDAYFDYHFAAALTALSIAAQRNAVMHLSMDDVYPNIWAFILGESTISRKSTSIRNLNRILKHDAIECHEIPKTITPEGLIEYLSESPKAFYINPEAAGFLKNLKKRYMAEISDYLCQLYDNDGISRRLAKNKNKESHYAVKEPYISTLFATTFENLVKTGESDHFTSGLFYRFLWFYPTYSRPTKPIAHASADMINLETELRDDIYRLYTFFSAHSDKPIVFQLTDEAIEEYNAWCQRLEQRFAREHCNHKLAGFSRLQIYALKLAMLITIGRKDADVEMDSGTITIHNHHLHEAMRLVEEYFLPMLDTVYENLDDALSTSDQKRILHAVRQRGGIIDRTNLLRKVRMRAKDFDDAIHTLVYETKEVVESEKVTGNHKTILYQLHNSPQ